MKATQLIHECLSKKCPEIHTKRLNTLMLACDALHECQTLSLTQIARAIHNDTRANHNIKCIDRLLGNESLHQERLSIYRWQAAFLCQNAMPIISVDWSDIREKERLMVLRAGMSLSGRSVTRYEQTFPLNQQHSAKAHQVFLKPLSQVLPQGCVPLLITDPGFRNTWFKAVEAQGWYWLSSHT